MRDRQRLAQQIVEYVEEHWKQRVTVKELSTKFGKDPSDIERLFRSATGITVARHVQRRLQEYVLSEVRNTTRFAYELANELNYREEHSFTRWVKNTFGTDWTTLCREQRDSPSSGKLPATARLRPSTDR